MQDFMYNIKNYCITLQTPVGHFIVQIFGTPTKNRRLILNQNDLTRMS